MFFISSFTVKYAPVCRDYCAPFSIKITCIGDMAYMD